MHQHESLGRSYYRVDTSHTRHTGLKIVQQELYRLWEIAVDHCMTGLTMRRDRYNVKILESSGAREEYLKGFSNRASAMEAARRRIDFIVDIRDPRAPRRRKAV